ncbi:MAG: glutamate--tRNA ligase family protein [Phycisphaerales bacterium]
MPHQQDDNSTKVWKTRLAPSPTGALHLGNAYAFLFTWALARQAGWRIVLRIEDLDGPRVKWGAADDIIDTLRWLGIDWDEGPYFQTADLAPYAAAMQTLAQARHGLSKRTESDGDRRRGRRAAGRLRRGAVLPVAPPGGLEHAQGVHRHRRNWRFATPECTVQFEDGLAGKQAISPAETIGDFALWTKRYVPSYQLAVVVDDARQGITAVVRGADLLDSAARQMLLYEALELGPPPSYYHLPLIVGPDGRRLAKRHGDSRVAYYRSKGVPAEAVIGLIGQWCGVTFERRRLSAIDFQRGLNWGCVPRGVEPFVFTPEDNQWLLSQT